MALCFTDSVGSPAVNVRFSERRANSIRGTLIRAGLSPAMPAAKGYGSFHPPMLASQPETVESRGNALAGDRGRNDRRVEFA